MKLRLAHRDSCPASASPYRLLDGQGQEVSWVNNFLDAQRVRGLSLRSLRAYGFDLLHFARWWRQSTSAPLAQIDESVLFDYVRFQLECHPKPSPRTVNHRLTVVRCLYRFHYGHEMPAGRSHLGHTYTTRSPLGYGKSRQALACFRLKQPQRVVVPLSAAEVSQFWSSFRTFRDLALVALMLFSGLRSREALQIQLEDLDLPQTQIRVHGKGNKDRVLPLSEETIQIVQHYLHLERPLTNSPQLFVCLKGRQRGRPMTPAGLRSLFRHHRRSSKVPQAHPHRLRHTFGTDMVRAGVSLPALMHLMGHSHIQTTMRYVELSREDVWREYTRAAQNRTRLSPPPELL